MKWLLYSNIYNYMKLCYIIFNYSTLNYIYIYIILYYYTICVIYQIIYVYICMSTQQPPTMLTYTGNI